MLDSFEIKNFRTFSHLYIERLARVNLIVGKNNVGKTTLLEALCIYSSPWPSTTIRGILEGRNEITRLAEDERTLLLLECLFHKREMEESSRIEFMSPDDRDEPCTIEARMDDKTTESFPIPTMQFMLQVECAGASFQLHADGSTGYSLDRGHPQYPRSIAHVPSSSLPDDLQARWWDAIALTDAEERVIEAVALISPIEKVGFVADPRRRQERMAKVRPAGATQPVSLRSLGDGVGRVFQIALGMEYAASKGEDSSDASKSSWEKSRVLLVDEIENGIHYSLHADLWRAIFKLARLRDVQVFATSHSWDCLKGFQEALASDDAADGQVIRLERKEGHDETRAVIIDRKQLPIVTRSNIEVR